MITIRWTADGQEYAGETPQGVVEAMRDASVFTSGESLNDYMLGVCKRSAMLGVLLEVRVDTADNFLDDLVAAKVIEYVA